MFSATLQVPVQMFTKPAISILRPKTTVMNAFHRHSSVIFLILERFCSQFLDFLIIETFPRNQKHLF